MSWQLDLYLSDFFLWGMVLLLTMLFLVQKKQANWASMWQELFHSHAARFSFIILVLYLAFALSDSLHFKTETQNAMGYVAIKKFSLLDYLLKPIAENKEETYSSPFADCLYVRQMLQVDGVMQQVYPKLKFAGGVTFDQSVKAGIQALMWLSVKQAALLCGTIFILFGVFVWRSLPDKIFLGIFSYCRANRLVPEMIFIFFLCWLLTTTYYLMPHYHIFGTDKIGQDVFYIAVKSIRTGICIALITTLVTLPIALSLGVMAGYYMGAWDSIIQFTYKTLNSIPAVLLIAASILSMQVFFNQHQDWFSSNEMRADIRLCMLCFILGLTSWTNLCRLLRAETLKIKNLDFVLAAKILGASHGGIMLRHIVPNVAHIILITLTLDFSMLILAEAVLAYVGIGVDPLTYSWGNLINVARLELAQDPIVWWSITAAFTFMFTLVLAINVFSDCLRDALDPKFQNSFF